MELVEGADLFDFRKEIADSSPDRKMPVPMVKNIARGILQALRGIHRNCVVHSDVKGENVMVGPNNSIKVGRYIYTVPPISISYG